MKEARSEKEEENEDYDDYLDDDDDFVVIPESPELRKVKHLEPSDNHHPKLDQKQEPETGPSSQVSSPKERLSAVTEGITDKSSNDLEEHAQLFQNREGINSEIHELAKQKHLGPTDNHHPKSDQNQELETGSSSLVSSPTERLLAVTEGITEKSSNDFEEYAQLFQNREGINSEIPELAKEKHLGPTDNHHPKSDPDQELETGSSSLVSSSIERLSESHISGGTRPDRLDQRRHDKNGKILILFDRDGYVRGKWAKNRLIKLHSCEFTHPHNNQTVHIRNQRPGYLFTFDEDDFIARVCFDKLQELDFDHLPVVNTKENFLKKLRIIEIIRDKAINCRDAAYMQFIQFLQDRSGKTVENLECAEDIFQLSIILEVYRLSPSPRGSILEDIVNNKYISSDFKNTVRELINREKALDARRKDFPQIDRFDPKNVFSELYKTYESAVKNHKTSLLEKCFSSISQLTYSMDTYINALSGQHVFYISNQDINLFCDLANEMDESFSIFLRNLQSLLFSKVMQVKNYISLKEIAPLTHPIYFHLCKHIQELILEISGQTDMSVNDLLKINKDGRMVLANCINWPTSPLNKCLEQQYRFVFKLMKHFKPVYSTKQKFKYQFQLSKRCGGKPFFHRIKGWFGSDKKSPDIPEERLVWMYILDNSIAELFPRGAEERLELFQPLLEGYMRFIQETEDVHYELFRTVMYNTVRFIAKAIPYLSEGASEIDRVTLTNQIVSIQNAISNKQFIDFRDLVDVYNEYWKNRESLVEKIPDKFPYGTFKNDMETIRQKLYSIVNTVLSKEVKPQELINYFRSFNEFLEDLSAVEFSWFIKESSDVTPEEVELVDTDKKSYKVLDPENFIKKHEDIPGHYLIEIIDDVLNSVSNLLGQKEWSDYDNINAASELVLAIKKSLLYLKEQPNYISFDTFKEESTEPFACVVEDSSSYKDFVKRVSIVGESFWYLRKQDEIDIKKALMLYGQENEDITTETEDILIDCYHKYLDKFNSYIQLTINKNYLDKIEFISKEVKDQSQWIDFHEWSENFKQETLPELLAGLAAVWSIQASKDIVSAKKTLKPHCIQVLCMLLLLSIDKDYKGVEKRFAQVLTGQGKSLIIGLTATLFALMGYTVKALCYSEYLAKRDKEDFYNFFMVFGVKNQITYGTFEDTAWEVLNPMVNGTRQNLGKLIKDRILNHSTEQFGQIIHDDRSNTILFIDEVDVFFSPRFYGSCRSTVEIISMPALADIQEYIWEMASKNYKRSIILNEVEEFIKKRIRERNEDFNAFKKFLIEPGDYYLLKTSNHEYVKKLYTNQSLYEEHRNRMVDDAIRVAKASDTDSDRCRYKINDYGQITYRDDNGFYAAQTYVGYFNVFNYFRLKKINYSHDIFCNYGYLYVHSGIISYANLPKEYPLILGVSGTLTTLNEHEKSAVRNTYSIRENSIMPSYFGDSNLQFNIHNDFVCETSEEQWLSKIDSHANSKIASGRSVLIFFETDIEINKFKNKFCSKYDRLYTLDENTEMEIKEKYINEAGITKTVTLATRGMGRGVDFKSSVAVEKKGGLHVIQTFMSLDIKEETQIKGRTARKDNKGSYELILCEVHLIKANLLKTKVEGGTVVTYERLNKSRNEEMKLTCAMNEDNIKFRDDQHKFTMEFFESFFKKKRSVNIEQPSENQACSSRSLDH